MKEISAEDWKPDFGDLEQREMVQEEMLFEVERAQPWYFRALLVAMEPIVDRVMKYAGDNNPYFNFERVAEINQVSVDEVFRFYISIKFARLQAQTGDFPDETFIDTVRDLANYALLYLGWLLKGEEE